MHFSSQHQYSRSSDIFTDVMKSYAAPPSCRLTFSIQRKLTQAAEAAEAGKRGITAVHVYKGRETCDQHLGKCMKMRNNNNKSDCNTSGKARSMDV